LNDDNNSSKKQHSLFFFDSILIENKSDEKKVQTVMLFGIVFEMLPVTKALVSGKHKGSG